MVSKFKCIRTDTGYHGRYVAGGKKVWYTEVYPRRRGVIRAAQSLERHFGVTIHITDVDERTVKT